MSTTTWRTCWQHSDIVVLRNDVEVDRLHGDDIARVYLVYRGRGETPGDIALSVVELAGESGFAVFEPNTGFAGRVNFERLSFWHERRCVYWVGAATAVLPWRIRVAGWRSDTGARAYRRFAHDELAAAVARWPLDVPQTWEDRKRLRIERARPFGYAHGAHA